jgi:NAD(P)-dependent dehydrogenase (short-subunit alcohol dehydrogenase family)
MSTTQSILITGASSGLGRLIAETLVRHGHTVFAGMRDLAGRNRRVAQAMRAQAKGAPGRLTPLPLDVTSDTSCEAAVGEVIAQAGRLDVLINNAGIGLHGLTECFTPDEGKALFEINFFGVVRMNRAALPAMRERRRGLLVHMSSGGGRALLPCMAYYCASKFALEALAESYRYELAQLGIDVTILEPGSYPSPFWGKEPGPSDLTRAPGYGALQSLPERMRGVYDQRANGPGGPDPREVADACLKVIEMTPGTCPVRLLVGARVQEVALINEAQAKVQQSFYAAYGVEHLMHFKPGG